MAYISRFQAAVHAQRKGNYAYSCHLNDEGEWTYRVELGNKTLENAMEWAKDKDFVSHIEMHNHEAVLIVTCFKHEFADMVVPFKVAPLTPSLWHDKGDDKAVSRADRTTGNGHYERSNVGSPVALAFSVYDANVGKSRKEMIALAMERGVHKNTASAQYYRWKTARNL